MLMFVQMKLHVTHTQVYGDTEAKIHWFRGGLHNHAVNCQYTLKNFLVMGTRAERRVKVMAGSGMLLLAPGQQLEELTRVGQ